MSKVRVYELARMLNTESKILVEKIKAMGIDVAGHQSTISALEAERIKTEIQGASQQNTSKVILRRRRPKASETETKESDNVDQPGSEEISASGAPDTEQAVEQTQEAVTPAVSEASEEVSAKSEPRSETAPAESEATPVQALEESVPEVASVAPEVSEAPQKSQEEIIAEIRAKKKAMLLKDGAKIIRKASPEERQRALLDAEEAAERARSSYSGPRSQSREDSKGTRLTGIGLTTAFPEEIPRETPTSGYKGAKSGKEEKSAEKIKEENDFLEAERKRKALPQKGRRQQINIRELLSTSLDPEEETDVVPVRSSSRKTVYTPSAMSKRDLKRRRDLKTTKITTPRAAYRVVKMEQDTIALKELAHQMSIKTTDLMKKLMSQGMMLTINSEVDFDTASLVGSDYGFEVKLTKQSMDDILKVPGFDDFDASKIVQRSPIVTVMGHVDHGKTSILDAIRETEVAAGEAGGITQHIGAYTVTKNDKTIAFLDTPGHEAFSQMRARGAQLTDIVVLVVAADDGVMPQTIEAISHAKEAGVPLIVAINKIDKPTANFDRVYTELSNHNVLSEEWGGETQFVKVSALKKVGLDELLEAILLQAEVLDLKAVPSANAEGIVIEAHLDKGRGPVATIMVQNGTLHVGDSIVAGIRSGRVRGMFDYRGNQVLEAGPSTPVGVIGLDEVPVAGDRVNQVSDEKQIKDIVTWRMTQAGSMLSKSSAATLEDLLGKISEQESTQVPIILKADTHGSVEALCDSLKKLNSNDKNVLNRIVHKGVGAITSSDISLAVATSSILIGFNVRAPKILEDVADKQGVVMKYFTIIYEVLDTVKSIMAGALPPVTHEEIIGHAAVRDCISVPKIGLIAGSAVTDGKIQRNAFMRLLRDNVIIYTGKVKSLRRFKDDVKEVLQGFECGIGLENCNDIQVGDVVEAYVIQETPATLELINQSSN